MQGVNIHARKMNCRGFTVVELLVVIAVLVIIVSLVLGIYSRMNRGQKVQLASGIVRSVLEDARSRTLASRDASQYGVHFATGSTTLFLGTSFSEGGSGNEVELLPVGTELSTISLTGGASDVVFERLTGSASATGTVTVSSTAGDSDTDTITIQETGLIILE